MLIRNTGLSITLATLALLTTACPDDGSTDGGDGETDTGETDDEVGTDETGTETGTEDETTTEDETDTTEDETDTTEDETETGPASFCGDGIVDDGEECDDGDANADDAECTSLCTVAVCGDGFVLADVEACDDAGESEACNFDCTPAVCGDGQVNPTAGEECEDQNDDNTDDCLDSCLAATCGDGFVWADNEACDDGNLDPGDGCDDTCANEFCTWDLDALDLPVMVHPANYYGEVAFDGDCNLVVAGAFEDNVYVVDGIDGTSSVLAPLAVNSINGIAYRESDDTVYVSSLGPNNIYGIDDGVANVVAAAPGTVNAITVAPDGFGDYGDLLISVNAQSQVHAIDPGDGTSTLIGTSSGILSALEFAPDGTLYIVNQANSRIETMTADGMVATFFEGGLGQPDGIAIDVDGSRMFVAHFQGGARVDEISLPGAQLTAGMPIALDGGYYVSGVVVDGDDNVIVKTQGANIDAYSAAN